MPPLHYYIALYPLPYHKYMPPLHYISPPLHLFLLPLPAGGGGVGFWVGVGVGLGLGGETVPPSHGHVPCRVGRRGGGGG